MLLLSFIVIFASSASKRSDSSVVQNVEADVPTSRVILQKPQQVVTPGYYNAEAMKDQMEKMQDMGIPYMPNGNPFPAVNTIPNALSVTPQYCSQITDPAKCYGVAYPLDGEGFGEAGDAPEWVCAMVGTVCTAMKIGDKAYAAGLITYRGSTITTTSSASTSQSSISTSGSATASQSPFNPYWGFGEVDAAYYCLLVKTSQECVFPCIWNGGICLGYDVVALQKQKPLQEHQSEDEATQSWKTSVRLILLSAVALVLGFFVGFKCFGRKSSSLNSGKLVEDIYTQV